VRETDDGRHGKTVGGDFMLRNCSSPETYFQAAFRVQNAWTVKNPDGESPNEEQIIKQECYVFDFAPDRALRQIADYSCRLNVNEANPEKNVEESSAFCPCWRMTAVSMKQIDAAGVLDMAMSGTTATLFGAALGKRITRERGQQHVEAADGK